MRPVPRAAGVITSLVARRGRSDRINVCIGGTKAFDLAAMVIEQAGLHVGDVVSEQAQADLLTEDLPYRARDRALRLLASRDHSRGEVEGRLGAAGFTPEVIADTIAWLSGLGYLDDRRFATRYCAEKQKQGWGPRRIKTELLRKGVERRLVDEAVTGENEGFDAGEGLQAATALARRRFGAQMRRDPTGAGRKLAGFLARRGYDWDTVAAVTRILAAEAGSDAETDDADVPGG